MENEKSFVMAKRLKELREGKRLSHVNLAKALKDQYGIEISRDSLMAYEVSDPNNTKAYRNEGMKVEYLRCLAEYYGVSVDYLLGYKNDRNVAPSAVDDLGLSQRAVYLLNMVCKESVFQDSLDGLNRLLEEWDIYSAAMAIHRLSEYILQVEKTDQDFGVLQNEPMAGVSGNQVMEEKLMNIITEVFPGIDAVCSISIGDSAVKQKKAEIMESLEELVNRVTGYKEYMEKIAQRNKVWEENGF